MYTSCGLASWANDAFLRTGLSYMNYVAFYFPVISQKIIIHIIFSLNNLSKDSSIKNLVIDLLCIKIMLTNDLYLSGHYPNIEDIDRIYCSTINTNNITYNKLQRLLDIQGK